MSSNQKNKSRISNPRRILILTPSTQSRATIPPFLHRLTGVPVGEGAAAAPSRALSSLETGEEGKKGSELESGTDNDNDNGCTTLPLTFSGYTTHAPFRLDTKYYTADVPIWVDEIPLPSQTESGNDIAAPTTTGTTTTNSTATAITTATPLSPSSWKSEFLGPEAREVRDVIGAVVLCICPPDRVSGAVPEGDSVAEEGRRSVDSHISRLKEIIEVVAEVKGRIDEERGGMGDVAGLVVLVGSGKESDSKTSWGGNREDDDAGRVEVDEFGSAWWEEELAEMGIFDFEIVNWHPTEIAGDNQMRRNEFGELQGMARIREVLEANEWDSPSDDYAQGLLDTLDDVDGFNLEANELQREMLGLRMSIENEEDDEDDLHVEQLESLVMRVQAIRDIGVDMAESERKEFAAKAIRDIMKDL